MKSPIAILSILLMLTSCVFLKPEYLQEIAPHELSLVLFQHDIFLVDVHIPEQRHIKGTDLFIPYNRVAENLHLFPADKTTPIYLYCETGPMGNAAARTLYQNGYKILYNLRGGSRAWQEADLEFE